MFKKALIAGAVASTLVSGAAFADDAAAPAPYTLTANVGIYSQYVFRGTAQSDKSPAVQGGFDFSTAGGFYLGTWASSISWLQDFGAYSSGGGMEWDFYGGFRNTIGSTGIGYDIGGLYYFYPGEKCSVGTCGYDVKSPDTFEVYGSLTYKWVGIKYSYSTTDYFGATDSDGTSYTSVFANIPFGDSGVTANLAFGHTEGDGAQPDYNDWKIGATYALPTTGLLANLSIGAYYTDTDYKGGFYTTALGRNYANSQFVGFVGKTF